jgi:diguanylate cyclase (GGDEF)-like protein
MGAPSPNSTKILPMVETLSDVFQSRRQMSKELDDVKEQLRIALNSMARGLSMFDKNQRLVLCNKRFRELYDLPKALTQPGASLERIVRTYHSRFAIRDEETSAAQQIAWIRRQAALLHEGEVQTRTQKLNEGRVLRVTIQSLPDGGWLDVQDDITEEARQQDELRMQTVRDELTRLANRRSFMERVNRALDSHTEADGAGFAIHLLEIRNFYTLLASVGLSTRDMCMREIGRQLAAVTGKGDLAARIDGDLFAVIRSEPGDEKDRSDFDVMLQATFSRPMKVLGHKVDLGARAASVLAPRDGHDADQLLDGAIRVLHG